MGTLVYVDNSNVWIEGMHVSAVERGLALSVWDAQRDRIVDTSWRFDFGRLYEFAGGTDVKRAFLYGSRPPANDSLWNMARAKGFEVVVFDRNVANKEKKIDTQLASDMIEHSYELAKAADDDFTLVSGDTDYVPVIEKLKRRGFKVDVCFWRHASRELKQAATRFVELDPWLDYLALRRDSR
jgi:uncharacterized LabA/DUF88 family protein